METLFEIIRVHRTGDVGIEFVQDKQQAEYRFYELERQNFPSLTLFEIIDLKPRLLKIKTNY